MALPKVITEEMTVQDVLMIAMKHEDNSRYFMRNSQRGLKDRK